jgi:hypothetical protein
MATDYHELTDKKTEKGEELYPQVNSKNCQQPVLLQGKHTEHCQSQSSFIRIRMTLGMGTTIT